MSDKVTAQAAPGIMTLNKRTEYGDGSVGQASKSHSLRKASAFVDEVIASLSPNLRECVYFEGDQRLGNAPAIEIPDVGLVVAPDIRCVTPSGKMFWVEVKDKSQRFYKPDTGADLFQVYGWHQIWKATGSAVYVLFKDPKYDDCLPRTTVTSAQDGAFEARWQMFKGQPYGGWLSSLLMQKENYPQIFHERSRDIEMYIFYFLTPGMESRMDLKTIIEDVDTLNIKKLPTELEAFFQGNLIEEIEIVRLIEQLHPKRFEV